MSVSLVKHILCPIDFSEKSLQVIDHATRLADVFGAKISALNVVDDMAPEYASYRRSARDMQALRRTLEQDSQNRMKLHIEPRLRSFADSQALTVFGKPAEVIVKVAKERRAELIMMATRSLGLASQFILGSTTYKIVRTAPCPLMVFSKPELKFRALRILFPTDFSELSMLSLPYLYKLALDYGSDVHIVHFRQAHNAASRDPAREMDALRRNAASNRIPFNRIIVNDNIKGVTPGAAVLKYAKDNGIDLIVLSAHGMSGYKQFFLGTTAVEVSSKSECPVLIVRKMEF
ncbi:MAG: universal stress protein [Chloroherpetonaceae bacterium]|nr:universal stress protein [Chloroherpetonaceae bacterium]MDW8437970.1 universal stress protein [Chloroherpetonaceae bacterium]